MIKDTRQIQIESPPESVFGLIEMMPDKFPIYRILKAQPFFFVRSLFANGLRTAIRTTKMDRANEVLILKVGESIGPFTLTELERPSKYWFDLRSIFLNCQTGYSLHANNNITTLNFDVIAEEPNFLEMVYWLSTKPLHVILTKKFLGAIKEEAEANTENKA